MAATTASHERCGVPGWGASGAAERERPRLDSLSAREGRSAIASLLLKTTNKT
jgi:hypothetical protein